MEDEPDVDPLEEDVEAAGFADDSFEPFDSFVPFASLDVDDDPSESDDEPFDVDAGPGSAPPVPDDL